MGERTSVVVEPLTVGVKVLVKVYSESSWKSAARQQTVFLETKMDITSIRHILFITVIDTSLKISMATMLP